MSARRMSALRALVVLLGALALVCALAPASALAGAPTWSGLEQPIPAGSSWPIGLGNVGDIEFWAPNRGMLITEGHPPTVPPGLWAYNGVEWHEYSSECGATQKAGTPNGGGRIAWAGPSELWTISDGRKGQANESSGTNKEREPPLEDNTLCHFAGGQIVGSYAHLAFEAASYQPMRAAACLAPSDCWFGGDPLEEPQVGAFHLHWNGSALEEEPYAGEGHAVEGMAALEGRLYESVQLALSDRSNVETSEPPVVHRSEGGKPFQAETNPIPLYGPEEPPAALGFLHLAVAGNALWGAAGADPAFATTPGDVTVVRRVRGIWSQVIGPGEPLSGTPANPLPPLFPGNAAEERELLGGEASHAAVRAIAAEPGTENAWLALAPVEEAVGSSQRAVLVHISADGEVLGTATLPNAAEGEGGIGPKGSASRLSCPAADDCWLATAQGWLFHLGFEGERQLPRDPAESEYFKGLITYRPPDQGLPQVVPDTPPADTSGLGEEAPDYGGTYAEVAIPPTKARTHVPLLSRLHTKLVHGSTLQLSFHLAAKARVRLLAKRKKKVVAKTATRVFAAGNRKLLLALNRRAWPTNLDLQTHALAELPTVETTNAAPGAGSVGVNTESTGATFLPHLSPFSGTLP